MTRIKKKDATRSYTHRIRRCNGNKQAWALVPLDDKGREIDGHIMTAMTIDNLLKHSKGLLPSPDDCVQIVYYNEAAA